MNFMLECVNENKQEEPIIGLSNIGKRINALTVSLCLRTIEIDPTFNNLAKFMASKYKMKLTKVIEPLKAYLERGVAAKFFIMRDDKYYLHNEKFDEDGVPTRMKRTVKIVRIRRYFLGDVFQDKK